jgi:hypothetical protein
MAGFEVTTEDFRLSPRGCRRAKNALHYTSDPKIPRLRREFGKGNGQTLNSSKRIARVNRAGAFMFAIPYT